MKRSAESTALTLIDDNLTSQEKYELYNDPHVKGYIARKVRGSMYVTLFVDHETGTLLALKHSDHVDSVIVVPFVSHFAQRKSQIKAVICPFANDGSVSLTYQGVF